MRKPDEWPNVWMDIAIRISKKSKDSDTQVGCVIVSPDNRRYFLGYNGFAKGIIENELRWQRPTKYRFILHAEDNALSNRNCDVNGWTCYVTLSPCEGCANRIVQNGIYRVIYLNWNDRANAELSPMILKEGGVLMEPYRK
ncbi:MAG: deoxycytidylate deaminase [Candidatus Hodarchaeales archaeon]|jgi:dCMP deaminase